jgi:WD40 repeat protein
MYIDQGQASGEITLVDLSSGKKGSSLDGHSGPITGLVFSPDATTLYSGSADKSLRTWKVDDGSEIGQVVNTAPVTAIALVSGASQIAAASADHTIRIWSLAELSKATTEPIA